MKNKIENFLLMVTKLENTDPIAVLLMRLPAWVAPKPVWPNWEGEARTARRCQALE